MTKFVGLLGRKAFSDSLSHSSANSGIATGTTPPSPAPVELDASALRHVSGGNGEQGPKKYW